jgi:hypothetical protein
VRPQGSKGKGKYADVRIGLQQDMVAVCRVAAAAWAAAQWEPWRMRWRWAVDDESPSFRGECGVLQSLTDVPIATVGQARPSLGRGEWRYACCVDLERFVQLAEWYTIHYC